MVWFFYYVVFFFFKQKTAYEMRISDWSSDVCSSDLVAGVADLSAISQQQGVQAEAARNAAGEMNAAGGQLGHSMTTTRTAAAEMRAILQQRDRKSVV